MNLRLLLASGGLITTASPVPAQNVHTVAGRQSGEILDSLQAGRKRWLVPTSSSIESSRTWIVDSCIGIPAVDGLFVRANRSVCSLRSRLLYSLATSERR
jgi:hypothetical protein